VHKIFPEPVNFIDRCGMISSYNQSWFFMANWQMQEYYDSKTPHAAEILENYKPAFILANLQSLDLDNLGSEPIEKRLLPRDESLFKDNYIHHWGPIYVPGKRLEVSDNPTFLNILVPGIYTVEASIPVTINGTLYMSGAYVDLVKGRHMVEAQERTNLSIRWGQDLYKPEGDPKGKHLFRGF